MIRRGEIVGETEGVERVEEAGDVESSSGDDRNRVDDGNSGFVIEDGDRSGRDPEEGNEMDDAACTVGRT